MHRSKNHSVANSPIFVIGCGRSGTTILGECIGAHRDVAYLHEPRAMWLEAFPQGDVWTKDAPERAGRIVLDAQDWTPQAATTIARHFVDVLHRRGRKCLCEKTPINAFRVDLIERIFPDARYIYIEREPLAVAQSIAERCKNGTWWGVGEYKWHGLAEMAEDVPELKGIAAQCVTDLQKALMERTLSMHHARRSLFGGEIAANRVLAISYEAFTRDPIVVANAIQMTANLPHDSAMLVHTETRLHPARLVETAPTDPVVMTLLAAAKRMSGA